MNKELQELLSRNNLKLFTDGGCIPVPQGIYIPSVGSWAYCIVDKENKIIHQESGKEYDTTNNRMEYTAFIKGVQFLKNNDLMNEEILAFSDSELLINTYNSWMFNWEKKQWKKKGGEIKNLDLVKILFEIKTQHQSILLSHIPGHQGYEFNEHCDQLCSNILRYVIEENPEYKQFTYYLNL